MTAFTFPTCAYAGKHLIVDMYGIPEQLLMSEFQIRIAMLSACKYAGATVLNSHFHHFGESNGLTGVVLLSESHMSIHTWPEINYAAIDVFMCGSASPDVAIQFLSERWNPGRVTYNQLLRGTFEPQA